MCKCSVFPVANACEMFSSCYRANAIHCVHVMLVYQCMRSSVGKRYLSGHSISLEYHYRYCVLYFIRSVVHPLWVFFFSLCPCCLLVEFHCLLHQFGSSFIWFVARWWWSEWNISPHICLEYFPRSRCPMGTLNWCEKHLTIFRSAEISGCYCWRHKQKKKPRKCVC